MRNTPIYRLLMCLLLIWLTGDAVAQRSQTTPDQPDLLIVVQVNAQDEYFGFTPGESPYADEILTALDEFFADSKLNVVFLTEITALSDRLSIFGNIDDYPTVFTPSSPTLALTIDTYTAGDAVEISPYSGYVHPPLPISKYDWILSTLYGGASSSELSDVVNGVAGVGGYIAGKCNFALPYLDQILKNKAVLAEGVMLDPGFYFYRGNCAYQIGDIEGAVKAYQQVIAYAGWKVDQSNPFTQAVKDPRLYSLSAATNLAWIYARQGETTHALNLLKDYNDIRYLSSFDARNLPTVFARTALYAKLEDYDSALAELDTLLEIVENNLSGFSSAEYARIYTERGNLYIQLEQVDAALADYQTAIAIDPAYPKVYYYLALVNEARGNHAAARVDYLIFISLAPGFFSYYEEDLTPYLERAQAALE